ncbi:MAG: flagellar hook-length control protein FliK [Calditrichae bacterium]|nr:flagellar hook-length control protein FliK [Calditrichia bacterium]
MFTSLTNPTFIGAFFARGASSGEKTEHLPQTDAFRRLFAALEDGTAETPSGNSMVFAVAVPVEQVAPLPVNLLSEISTKNVDNLNITNSFGDGSGAFAGNLSGISIASSGSESVPFVTGDNSFQPQTLTGVPAANLPISNNLQTETIAQPSARHLFGNPENGFTQTQPSTLITETGDPVSGAPVEAAFGENVPQQTPNITVVSGKTVVQKSAPIAVGNFSPELVAAGTAVIGDVADNTVFTAASTANPANVQPEMPTAIGAKIAHNTNLQSKSTVVNGVTVPLVEPARAAAVSEKPTILASAINRVFEKNTAGVHTAAPKTGSAAQLFEGKLSGNYRTPTSAATPQPVANRQSTVVQSAVSNTVAQQIRPVINRGKVSNVPEQLVQPTANHGDVSVSPEQLTQPTANRGGVSVAPEQLIGEETAPAMPSKSVAAPVNVFSVAQKDAPQIYENQQFAATKQPAVAVAEHPQTTVSQPLADAKNDVPVSPAANVSPRTAAPITSVATPLRNGTAVQGSYRNLNAQTATVSQQTGGFRSGETVVTGTSVRYQPDFSAQPNRPQLQNNPQPIVTRPAPIGNATQPATVLIEKSGSSAQHLPNERIEISTRPFENPVNPRTPAGETVAKTTAPAVTNFQAAKGAIIENQPQPMAKPAVFAAGETVAKPAPQTKNSTIKMSVSQVAQPKSGEFATQPTPVFAAEKQPQPSAKPAGITAPEVVAKPIPQAANSAEKIPASPVAQPKSAVSATPLVAEPVVELQPQPTAKPVESPVQKSVATPDRQSETTPVKTPVSAQNQPASTERLEQSPKIQQSPVSPKITIVETSRTGAADPISKPVEQPEKNVSNTIIEDQPEITENPAANRTQTGTKNWTQVVNNLLLKPFWGERFAANTQQTAAPVQQFQAEFGTGTTVRELPTVEQSQTLVREMLQQSGADETVKSVPVWRQNSVEQIQQNPFRDAVNLTVAPAMNLPVSQVQRPVKSRENGTQRIAPQTETVAENKPVLGEAPTVYFDNTLIEEAAPLQSRTKTDAPQPAPATTADLPIEDGDTGSFAGNLAKNGWSNSAVTAGEANVPTTAPTTGTGQTHVVKFQSMEQFTGKMAAILQEQFYQLAERPQTAAQQLFIQIEPHEMGVIRLRLRMKHQKLVGSIETGLPETSALLQNGQSHLLNKLGEMGVQVQEFNINYNDQLGSQQQFAREQTQQQQTNARHSGTLPDNDPAPETPNPQPRMFGQNGVDVTV